MRIEIKKDGMWPVRWTWYVWGDNYDLRMGFAVTKDQARRKAIKAKHSMEIDDVDVGWNE